MHASLRRLLRTRAILALSLSLCAPVFGAKETAPWQSGVIISVETSTAYTEVAVAVSNTLYVCRPFDNSVLGQFNLGLGKRTYVRVNTRDVRAGASAQLAVFSNGLATLRSEGGQRYACEVISQRYYPTQTNSEPSAQQAQPPYQPATASSQSNSDAIGVKRAEPESERPTLQHNVAPPTGDLAPEPKVLLLQNSSFVELETFEAHQRDTNGSRIYSLSGRRATARTRSSRPAFLVSTDLARELELYQLEVTDDARLIVFSVKNQQVAFPTAVTIETVSDGVSRIIPSADLAPGEYILSPKSSNQSFLFGVD